MNQIFYFRPFICSKNTENWKTYLLFFHYTVYIYNALQWIIMSKQHVFKCRLDTLTDGSEFTGSGTIFLTIVRVSPSQEETIVARYALNGISPLISRLASDQALKLSHVRACFLNSMGVDCTAGLAALLLSLSNYSITSYNM